MKKHLISLMALVSLAACGGGGGGGDTTAPSASNGTAATAPATPQTGNNNLRTRLDACPFAVSSQSPDSAKCLAGNYSGTDIYTKEACLVTIQADGTTVATRGSTSIRMTKPNIGPIYTKVSYSVIGNTSPVGYSLIWVSSYLPDDKSGKKEAETNFNFNSNYDGKLTIEVKNSAKESITCQTSL